MGALLEPVGPLGAGTYWRRRLMVIALLLVAFWLISRIGGDDEPAAATSDGNGEVSVTEPGQGPLGATPSPLTAGAADDPTAPPQVPLVPPTAGLAAEPVTSADGIPPHGATGGPQPCSEAELSLAVAASSARYAEDAQPELAVAVETTGAAPCTHDFGPAGLGVVITSGRDRIWASQDCGAGPADVRVVTPGTPVTLQMTWARVRSEPGCPAAGSPARAGTYVATPVAGQRIGQPAPFLLD